MLNSTKCNISMKWNAPGGGGGGGGRVILSTIYDHSKSNLHILDAKRNENHTCTKRKLLCSNDVSQ